MINPNMRFFNYLTYEGKDDYGQPVLSNQVKGQIKMSIYATSKDVQDNINYYNAQYMGLTHADVDDTYVIIYGEERLKVLYVVPVGRFKQVFMAKQ